MGVAKFLKIILLSMKSCVCLWSESLASKYLPELTPTIVLIYIIFHLPASMSDPIFVRGLGPQSSVLTPVVWQMTRSRIHFSRIPPTIKSSFLHTGLYFIKFYIWSNCSFYVYKLAIFSCYFDCIMVNNVIALSYCNLLLPGLCLQ